MKRGLSDRSANFAFCFIPDKFLISTLSRSDMVGFGGRNELYHALI